MVANWLYMWCLKSLYEEWQHFFYNGPVLESFQELTQGKD